MYAVTLENAKQSIADQWLSSDNGRGGWEGFSRARMGLLDDGYVHCLGRGGPFTGDYIYVHICKLIHFVYV